MWLWFIIFVFVLLLIDFYTMKRQGAHRISFTEASIWSIIWVAVSMLFLVWMWWHMGGTSLDPGMRAHAHDKSLEFLTGYLVEKALAVDNIFVFLILFNYFAVPAEYQKRVLMIGILGALVLRAVMILLGAWAIDRFHWILYAFGIFLIFTAVKMWWAAGQEPDLDSNPLLKWVRRKIKISPKYDGEKLFTVVDGVKMATPLFLVILLIGIVDVIFAVDSIPAIFAITRDPFIVLSSNVFAILGLRAMYFMLAGIHDRFHLLPYGLALVLLVIGTKMLLMDVYKIPVLWSLLATVAILAVTMVLSLLTTPKKHYTGAYPFSPKKEDKD